MQGESTSLLLRSVCYIFLVAGFSLLVHLDAQFPVSKFTEFSLTERAQEIIFLCLAIGFLIHANYVENTATLARLLSGFFLISFIREMDYILDNWAGDGTWQVLVTVVLIAMTYTARRGWPNLVRQLGDFLRTPSFGLFLAGFLTTFIFSRILGYSGLWEAVMGDDYVRNVKNAVEESIELLGDALLLIASIEFYFQCRSQTAADTIRFRLENWAVPRELTALAANSPQIAADTCADSVADASQCSDQAG